MRTPVVLGLAMLVGSAGCGARGPESASPSDSPSASKTLSSGACVPSPSTGARLEVVVLGSGGPVPGRRACASHVVLLDGVPRVMVDAGPGAAVRLGEAGIDTTDLDVVLLTHLHVDHAGDLPGVVKARDLAHDGPVGFFVSGPSGRGAYPPTHALVDGMLGPHGAFAYLASFRNKLDIDGTDLALDRGADALDVLERPGLRITAVATVHGDAPAVAYRIEHAGHAVVFGGDTTLSGDGVSKLAAGADLFVANATVLDPPAAPAELYRLHATPTRIGEVARDARVGAVALAHLPPAVAARGDEVIASVKRAYGGSVALTQDCQRLRADGVGAR